MEENEVEKRTNPMTIIRQSLSLILAIVFVLYYILLLSTYAWLTSDLVGFIGGISFALILISLITLLSKLAVSPRKQIAVLLEVVTCLFVFILILGVFWNVGILAVLIALASAFLVGLALQSVFASSSSKSENHLKIA